MKQREEQLRRDIDVGREQAESLRHGECSLWSASLVSVLSSFMLLLEHLTFGL